MHDHTVYSTLTLLALSLHDQKWKDDTHYRLSLLPLSQLFVAVLFLLFAYVSDNVVHFSSSSYEQLGL